MRTTQVFNVLSLVSVYLYGAEAKAQTIVNDTLVVSTEATAEIVFPSSPNGTLLNPDGSYDVNSGTKKSLIIKANKKDAQPQSLTVEENSHKHHFVLVYNESAPPLRRDWSKQKNLTAHIKEMRDRATAGLAEADALFGKAEYDAALAKYSRLVYDVEEAEREPIRSRIAECTQHSESAKQKSFQNAVSRGDAYAAAAKFKEADAAYAEALRIFPADATTEAKRKKNKDTWYKIYTKRADSADIKNNYILARALLEEAKIADPNGFKQAYEKKFARIATDAITQAYEEQKKKGNEAFDLREFDGAIAAFDSARRVDPKETYCAGKINEVKKEKEKEAGYYSLLFAAKTLAAKGDSKGAIAEYQKAQQIFRDRRFPKDRITALQR